MIHGERPQRPWYLLLSAVSFFGLCRCHGLWSYQKVPSCEQNVTMNNKNREKPMIVSHSSHRWSQKNEIYLLSNSLYWS